MKDVLGLKKNVIIVGREKIFKNHKDIFVNELRCKTLDANHF